MKTTNHLTTITPSKLDHESKIIATYLANPSLELSTHVEFTHSTHLSSMRSSYRHLTVQNADGSPLSVIGQSTLCSDSFYVRDVSLVADLTMQFMSAE
jgi:hypothetical protein